VLELAEQEYIFDVLHGIEQGRRMATSSRACSSTGGFGAMAIYGKLLRVFDWSVVP
jgi:hypothetical protein